MSRQEILTFAHTGIGEWTELAEEYCYVTDAPVQMLISSLEKLGLTPTDIHNLENLEDKAVLRNQPGGFRWLKKNKREDVIIYFNAFADLLAAKLERESQVVHFDFNNDWIENLLNEQINVADKKQAVLEGV